MEKAAIMDEKVEPGFDLEEFMTFSRESRLQGGTLENLMLLWEKWLADLKVRRIGKGSNSWLAIWLPEAVEKEVDEAWARSPGEGFLVNNLAQYMCMAAVGELLPQTAEGGCAPSPKSSGALAGALAEAGLEYADGTLKRRYGVLTYYPFKGGCEICGLRENCPRANGGESMASVILPGHERGAG